MTALPLKQMWADDEYWVPVFLKGQCFEARFDFDDDSTAPLCLRRVILLCSG